MPDERTYKWAHPALWLIEKIQKLVIDDDIKQIAAYFSQLAEHVDPDTIQDLFQEEMIEDGYFQPLTESEIAKMKYDVHWCVISEASRGTVVADGWTVVTANEDDDGMIEGLVFDWVSRNCPQYDDRIDPVVRVLDRFEVEDYEEEGGPDE